MGLVYKWYPSPSYSPGAIGSNPRLLVVHTTEGATTNDSIKNFLTGHNGVSYHASVDNHMDNVCYEYVYEQDGAWAQCGYNNVAVCCVFCTPTGASANWSASYWQNNQALMMNNMAKWLADQSKQYGIPLTELTSSQAQGSGRGVCQHKNLGSGGCSHSDCGNMPMGHLLTLARNYASGTPPAGGTPPSGPVAGEDYMVYPGIPGQWLKLDTKMAGSGLRAGLGIGTNGNVYLVTKTFSADSAWRGPTKIA